MGIISKKVIKNIMPQKYVNEEFGHELQLLLDLRKRVNSMMKMVITERFYELKNALKSVD